jgi:hypothetical protein
MAYVYKQTEKAAEWLDHEGNRQYSRGLWTVGFYAPDGEWMPESDYGSPKEAASRVNYLNGGNVSFAE